MEVALSGDVRPDFGLDAFVSLEGDIAVRRFGGGTREVAERASSRKRTVFRMFESMVLERSSLSSWSPGWGDGRKSIGLLTGFDSRSADR